MFTLQEKNWVFLVKRPFSLLDLVGLQNRLKDIFHREVDVVTENGVSKYMKPAIMRDLTVFYGKR